LTFFIKSYTSQVFVLSSGVAYFNLQQHGQNVSTFSPCYVSYVVVS